MPCQVGIPAYWWMETPLSSTGRSQSSDLNGAWDTCAQNVTPLHWLAPVLTVLLLLTPVLFTALDEQSGAGNRRVCYQCGILLTRTCLYSLTMDFGLYHQSRWLLSSTLCFILWLQHRTTLFPAPPPNAGKNTVVPKVRHQPRWPSSKQSPSRWARCMSWSLWTVMKWSSWSATCAGPRTRYWNTMLGGRSPLTVSCPGRLRPPHPSRSQLLTGFNESLHQVILCPWPRQSVGERPVNAPSSAHCTEVEKQKDDCCLPQQQAAETSAAAATLLVDFTLDTDSNSYMENKYSQSVGTSQW